MAKKSKKNNPELVSSLLYVIIGVLLIVFRSQTLGWAMTAIGAIFVISGALDLAKQNYTSGTVSLVIGLAILVLGWAAAQIVLLVLGVLIAVKGFFALVDVLQRKRKNALAVLFPILTIAVGLMLAFGNGLDIVILITGILLTVDGALGLAAALNK